MIGLIVNEDKRMKYLSKMLDCIVINKLSDLIECDELVLPVQGIDSSGLCYHTNIHILDILATCQNLNKIYSGIINEELMRLCFKNNIKLVSYLKSDTYTYNNSILTVLGFIKYILNKDEMLLNKKIAIMGYGNLGKLLSKGFKGLNIKYDVFSIKEINELLINNENIVKDIFEYDVIINTIPVNIINECDYFKLINTQIYDLSSYPYGFNPLKIKFEQLGSIPGKEYPYLAAKLLYEEISRKDS